MNSTRHSLLRRRRDGDADAWNSVTALYRPLIANWLRRVRVASSDVEDLSQNVMLALVKNLPTFEHSGRPGAFRSWLRVIVFQNAGLYWRDRKRRNLVVGSEVEEALEQLEAPASELVRQWDEEHDRYIFRCLLDVVELEFEPSTRQAFRRLALDGASGAEAAAELGLSVSAVYVAKSRVLQRLRQEAEGLVD